MNDWERLADQLRRTTDMRIETYLGIIGEVGWRKVRTSGSHVMVEDSEGQTHSIPTKNGRTVKATYLKLTARRITEINRDDDETL